MTNDAMTGLFDYFTQVKQQIIDAAIQKGILATGKTLGSLQITSTASGYELQANSNIWFIEHGRGPTSPGASPGNPNLVEIITDWLEAKGLNINPYSIANTIHKNGTKLYRDGGNSGILSVPLNLDTLDTTFDEIASKWFSKTSTDIIDSLLTL